MAVDLDWDMAKELQSSLLKANARITELEARELGDVRTLWRLEWDWVSKMNANPGILSGDERLCRDTFVDYAKVDHIRNLKLIRVDEQILAKALCEVTA